MARRAATSTVEPLSPTFAGRSSTSFGELSTRLMRLPTACVLAVHIEQLPYWDIERFVLFSSVRQLVA
jgi:hypothetical protein